MSISYSIVSIVEADYQPDNIEVILTKGEKFGCKYLKEVLSFDADLQNPIRVQEAVRILFAEEPRFDGEPFPAILANNDGAFFLLFFGVSNCGNLRVTLSIGGYPWERKFFGYAYKDFARYTRLILDITDDFPLLDICMEKI